MRIETVHGRHLVCGHIFKFEEIEVGQVWASADGSDRTVRVTRTRPGQWVEYEWEVQGQTKSHQKDSFSFQCRYCLVVSEEKAKEIMSDTQPDMILIRGIPGSGKSTIAKSFFEYVHLETDMFFLDDSGSYLFCGDKIKIAHDWCFDKVVEALSFGKDVVVSNTFTQLWEMEKYLHLAATHNLRVGVITAAGDYGNIHNVPESVVENMKNRFVPHEDLMDAIFDAYPNIQIVPCTQPRLQPSVVIGDEV